MSSSGAIGPLSPGSCCRIPCLPVLSPRDLTVPVHYTGQEHPTFSEWSPPSRLPMMLVLVAVAAVALSTTGYRRRGQIHRRHRLRRVSVVATRCPEPPPRPAPGWVEAPICQSRPTGVAWRPDEARGRHRRLWSSSAEPPYGSPPTALGLRWRRSSGVRTSIARILSRRSGEIGR